MVNTREVAEELLQETFFTFLRQVERLPDRPNLRPYLLRIARSRAYDFLRKERCALRVIERQKQDPLLRSREADGFTAYPAGPPEEIQEQLLLLPDKQREVVILKAVEGLTFKEIGRITGVPESTAVSRYRYGLEKLRTALQTGGARGSIR